MDVAPSAVEITAVSADIGKACKHCGGPVTPPTRKGQVKDFCRDQCRAAYALDQKRKAVEQVLVGLAKTQEELATAREQLQTVADEVQRLAAQVEGAVQFVQMHLVVGRKERKKQPAVHWAAQNKKK